MKTLADIQANLVKAHGKWKVREASTYVFGFEGVATAGILVGNDLFFVCDNSTKADYVKGAPKFSAFAYLEGQVENPTEITCGTAVVALAEMKKLANASK